MKFVLLSTLLLSTAAMAASPKTNISSIAKDSLNLSVIRCESFAEEHDTIMTDKSEWFNNCLLDAKKHVLLKEFGLRKDLVGKSKRVPASSKMGLMKVSYEMKNFGKNYKNGKFAHKTHEKTTAQLKQELFDAYKELHLAEAEHQRILR